MDAAAQIAELQRAKRSFQQNPTPSMASIVKRLASRLRRNHSYRTLVMQQELDAALAAYRKALLETAFADLAALKCGAPRQAGSAQPAMAARARVLAASRKLTASEFTAACMEAGFIR